jgi:hypothetical protein
LFALNHESWFSAWSCVDVCRESIDGLPPNDRLATLLPPSSNAEFTRTRPAGIRR